MSMLGAFCNQLLSFIEDIAESYPEERDIKTAVQAIQMMKLANPRLVHTLFMEHIYSEFAEYILKEDEEYILQRAQSVLNEKHTEFKYAFWIFDKHWSNMSESNKQQVWKYLKTLIILAQKVSQ